MAARIAVVVCAWCNQTMSETSTALPVTHTICPSCLDWSVAHPTQVVQSTPPGYFGDLVDRLNRR
jgi:hypothetical protein